MKKRVFTNDIILILIASFFYMASPLMVSPLMVGFSIHSGAAATVAGLMGGLMNLTSMVCRPIAGNLSDRISKYKLTFIGASCMLIATLGYAASMNFAMIVISRIIHGIGFACCSVCLSTWMSNLLPADKIGSGMGFYGMINALSSAAAPSLSIMLYQRFGYRFVFVIATLCSVATILLIQFIKDRDEPEKEMLVGQELSLKSFKILDIRILYLALIIMLIGIPYFVTQSCLVSYVELRGLALNTSLFFTVYALFLLVLRLTFKSWLDKKPFVFFLILSTASSAIAIICFILMKQTWTLLVAAVFMAGGFGFMCTVCQSTAIIQAGEGKRGLANSTYYLGMDVSMTLGPILGGFLLEHLDIHYFYPVMLITVPLILLVYFIQYKIELRRIRS